MTFVPAFLGARLRFLLQFKSQAGATLDVPAGAYVCRFYKVQGGPVSFEFSTSAADLIVRTTGDKGIEFDRSMAAIAGLESRRYLWQLHKVGAPEEWMASGDLTVGQNGGIESRFRVFEAYNGALPKIVAPAFQGERGLKGDVGDVNPANIASQAAAEAAAVASAISAGTAANASLANGYYPGAQANVPRGVIGTSALVAGSGGANGTFALAFTGGNFAVNPVGTFTVAGGLVTAVNMTSPGLYVGASPIAPTASLAASAGLTGASVVLTVDFLVQAGKYYWTDHATDPTLLSAYYRNVGAAVISSPLVTLSKSSWYELLGTNKVGVAAPAAVTVWGASGVWAALPIALTDGYVTALNFQSPVAQRIWLTLANGAPGGGAFGAGGAFTVGRVITVMVAAGANTIDLKKYRLKAVAGQYAFIRAQTSFYITSGLGVGVLYWYSSAAFTDLSDVTFSYGSRLEANLVLENDTRGKTATLDGGIADGVSEFSVGPPVVTLPSPIVGNNARYAYGWAAPFDCFAKQLRVFSPSAQALSVLVGTRNSGSGLWTWTESMSLNIPAGESTHALGLKLVAGQRVAFQAQTGLYYISGHGDPLYFQYGDFSTVVPSLNQGNQIHSIAFDFEGVVKGAGPAALARLTQLSAITGVQWSGKKWAALGSSIVADNSWTLPMSSALGLTLQNLGAGGQTLVNNGTIWANINSIAVDTHLVTLSDLINDFASGVALGALPTAAISNDTTTFYNALASAIVAIRLRAPSAAIVLETMYGAGLGAAGILIRNPYAVGAGSTRLWQWQKAVQDVAEMLGVHVIDSGRKAGIGYETASLFTTDGLHLNATGGARRANYTGTEIKKIPVLV